MLRSKVRRATLLQKPKSFEHNVKPSLDTWLSRLSQFAQFGLFIFTLAFSYFTVLPIYQKSVLEEAIAQKTVELSELNSTFEAAYERLRKYAVRDLYIAALPACTNLLRPPITTNNSNSVSQEEAFLSSDAATCILKISEEVDSISVLKPIDRNTLKSAITRISKEIEEKRKASLVSYMKAEETVTNSDWGKMDSNNYQYQAQMIIEGWEGGVPNLEARRKILVTTHRREISSAYLGFIADRLRSLSNIPWNEATSAQ